MPFTYTELIQQAKETTNGIVGTHVPMFEMHYIEFAEKACLDIDQYPTLESYIQKASYDEKKDLFRQLGFSVLFMTLSAIKVSHYIRDHVEEAFLNNERNVFLIDVCVGMKSLYFLLEYQDQNDPLAAHTVDREALKREKEQQERIRNIFFKNRNKS